MVNFIQSLVGNDYVATVIMSLIPLIELKGGIVFAQGAGLGILKAFLLGYLGSTLVFFPVYFLLVPLLNLLKKIKWFNNFACRIENYFKDKATDAVNTSKNTTKSNRELFIKKLGVFLFVAIPLPMTGVWTGTAVAVFLNLKFKDAILPVIIGNFIAGVLITLLSMLCTAIGINLDYVLYALFGLAVIILIITIVKISKKRTE